MKEGRTTVIGIVIVGASLVLSGVALAAEGGARANQEHEQAEIKLLQDAAAALRLPRPALSNALRAYAIEEANEPAHKTDKEEEHEVAEKRIEGTRESHLNLLRDAAVALQVSRPDLATQLTESADRMAKRIKKNVKKDLQEVGEKK